MVSAIHLTNVGSYQAKVVYTYDDPARLDAVPAAATQHDTTYNTSFTARGNVTSVSRWDVTDINNDAKKLATYTSYYPTGTPISSTDPSGHTSTMLYADSFSNVSNQNTFAYTTTIRDADNYESTIKYNFDLGAVTRTQDPKGAVQTIDYDGVARTDRITNETSGAYVRYFYGTEVMFLPTRRFITAPARPTASPISTGLVVSEQPLAITPAAPAATQPT